MTTSGEEENAWTPAQRVGFRFAFSYFTMFAAGSLLDSGAGPRALLAALSNPVVSLFARALFGVSITDRTASIRIAVAQQLGAFVVAGLIAALWSLVARRREYRRLLGWFSIALRYYVGVVMSVYGGLKLIDTQFPPIALDQLSQPLGSLSPMALLWAYMGYSSLYTGFTGLGECLGAWLLFFRRTTTAGALILVAVLSNVALINYVYDVPVKQLSTNLLLACVFLAATDARRLIKVFLRNETAPSIDLSFPLSNAQRRLQWVIRPLVIVGAMLGPLTASFLIRRTVILRHPPLYGVYDVVRFERNGVDQPPLATDGQRWRRATFSAANTLSVRFMNDSVRSMRVNVDTTAHRLTLTPASDHRDVATLAYRTTPGDSLEIAGRLATTGDSVVIRLERIGGADAFRLTRAASRSTTTSAGR